MDKQLQELLDKYNQILEPCPHCGAKSEIHLGFGNRYAAFCMSDKCGAMLLYTRTPVPIPLTQFRTLVHRWNRRVKDGEQE